MSPDDLLKRLETKIDKVGDDLGEVKGDLREHMRRTAANEEGLALLRAEVEPLKAHVAMWLGAWKVVVVVGALAGSVVSLIKLLGH